jgi:hypothetical protein
MRSQLHLLAALLLVGSPLQATTIYGHSTDLSGSVASQYDPVSGEIAKAYDNFTLSAASSVTGLGWVGSYFFGSSGGINGFLVEIWGDSAGVPGSNLFTATVSGNANETSLGNDSNGDPTFIYNASLATPFAAAAGTSYWLSIQPTLAGTSQWGWENGTGGDGTAYQVFFGSPTVISNDLTFSLNSDGGGSVSVPEPGTATLLLLGLAAFRARRPNGVDTQFKVN